MYGDSSVARCVLLSFAQAIWFQDLAYRCSRLCTLWRSQATTGQHTTNEILTPYPHMTEATLYR